MDFLAVLMDIIPPSMPPGEPGLIAKLLAAISAAVGGIVWSAAKLINKAIKKNEGDKK